MYTSSKNVALVYCESQATRQKAYSREYELKRFSKKAKEALINTYHPIPVLNVM